MPKSLLLAACFLFANITFIRPAVAADHHPTEEEDRHDAARGITLMMDGDLDGAVSVAKEVEAKDPDSPLGYILEANATWWRIYYSSANLIDPDVFDVANMEATPYDSHFEDIDRVAIRKAEEEVRNQHDVARNLLYEGFAYALRARLDGLHDRDLPTARSGKKMRALLLQALQMDPTLMDAYLGLGIYNYFVDTLSSIVKILSVFIGLPGGSRTEGLRQLQLCAEKGELVRGEAKFYLAKDYSRNSEGQYEKSLRLFSELAQEYPHNPLWTMLAASLHFRMGQPQKGEAIYRQVYQSTAGKNSDVEVAVHKAATEALARLHPDQKFQ